MTPSWISEERRTRIRQEAGDRCGYCLSPQHLVLGTLEIDHLQPKAAGGNDEDNNLWLACRLCNNAKAAQTESFDPVTGRIVPLFNPRLQHWPDHFRWSRDGTRILGHTPIGRATIVALQLNHLIAVIVRRHWVTAGWHPPEEKR